MAWIPVAMATITVLLQGNPVAAQTFMSCEHARAAGVTRNGVVTIGGFDFFW